MTEAATETWAVGYTARDFSRPEVAIDDEGHIETKFEYAYYRNFDDAKEALLGILGISGLEMVRNEFPFHVISHMAQATVEFMNMTKEDFLKERHEDPMVCDVDGQMGFFLANREIKKDESRKKYLTFELVADHRKCTEDFCYGEFNPHLN